MSHSNHYQLFKFIQNTNNIYTNNDYDTFLCSPCYLNACYYFSQWCFVVGCALDWIVTVPTNSTQMITRCLLATSSVRALLKKNTHKTVFCTEAINQPAKCFTHKNIFLFTQHTKQNKRYAEQPTMMMMMAWHRYFPYFSGKKYVGLSRLVVAL